MNTILMHWLVIGYVLGIILNSVRNVFFKGMVTALHKEKPRKERLCKQLTQKTKHRKCEKDTFYEFSEGERQLVIEKLLCPFSIFSFNFVPSFRKSGKIAESPTYRPGN